jgi:hypothetical protein
MVPLLGPSRQQDEDMQGATEEKMVIGQVVWQEPSSVGDTVEDSHVRRFDGEIHLPKEMQASCGFKLFRISVSPPFYGLLFVHS